MSMYGPRYAPLNGSRLQPEALREQCGQWRGVFQARVRQQAAEAALRGWGRPSAAAMGAAARSAVSCTISSRPPGDRFGQERVELRGRVERREAVGERFRAPLVRRHRLDADPECLHLRAELAQADTRGQRGELVGGDALGEIRGRRERDLVPAGLRRLVRAAPVA